MKKLNLLFILTLFVSCISEKYSIDADIDQDLKSYLERQQVPLKVIKELFDNLPEKTPLESDGYFGSEKSIFNTNKPESWFNFQKNSGLLVVGFCPNGDPVVMDVKVNKGFIYYLSHEEMSDDLYTFEDISIKVANSPQDYINKKQQDSFPWDYWQALNKLPKSPYMGFFSKKNQQKKEKDRIERELNPPSEPGTFDIDDPFAK